MVRRSELPPHLRELVEKQIAAEQPFDALAAAWSGKKGSVHTGKGARKGPTALERRFGLYLEALKEQRQISGFRFEPLRVILPAKRLTYTPDYLVRQAPLVRFDGSHPFESPLTFVEVKPRDNTVKRRCVAYWGTGKSRIKTKLAAEAMKGLIDVIAAWPADNDDWTFERF